MSTENLPPTPPAHSPQVVLYTRSGCHLCDEARDILQRSGLAPRTVDIDADTQVREQSDTCVPVVEMDGKIRVRGRVNEVLLRRLLRQSPVSSLQSPGTKN